jgi:hypothetical protein
LAFSGRDWALARLKNFDGVGEGVEREESGTFELCQMVGDRLWLTEKGEPRDLGEAGEWLVAGGYLDDGEVRACGAGAQVLEFGFQGGKVGRVIQEAKVFARKVESLGSLKGSSNLLTRCGYAPHIPGDSGPAARRFDKAVRFQERQPAADLISARPELAGERT